MSVKKDCKAKEKALKKRNNKNIVEKSGDTGLHMVDNGGRESAVKNKQTKQMILL